MDYDKKSFWHQGRVSDKSKLDITKTQLCYLLQTSHYGEAPQERKVLPESDAQK